MKSIWAFSLLLVWPACAQFEFKDLAGKSLELREADKPVFVYHYGRILAPGFPEKMSRSSYLHPVYAPDGTVLTDDFNPDHAHHRGISWMWPNVTVDGKTYDLWTVGDIKHGFVRWVEKRGGKGLARLAVENGWYIGERKVVHEIVEITVHPAKENVRVMDFALQFEAEKPPVEIVGTPDQKKGFGGFCFRFAPRDGGRKNTVIRTEKGVSEKDGVLEVHPWAQVEGVFQGKKAGGRIDDDPSNPGFPNGWLMRYGFGFLNVSYPGLTPVKLEKGKPLRLKYRVTVWAGDAPAR